MRIMSDTSHPPIPVTLLPCPFCGGEARWGYHDCENGEHYVCVECGVEKPSIKDWNRRTHQTPDSSVVQQIEAACTDHSPYGSSCSISRRDAERIARALYPTPDLVGLVERLKRELDLHDSVMPPSVMEQIIRQHFGEKP